MEHFLEGSVQLNRDHENKFFEMWTTKINYSALQYILIYRDPLQASFLLKLILVHNTLGIIKNFSELNHSMIFLNISYNESTYCYMLWWWSKVEKLGTDS